MTNARTTAPARFAKKVPKHAKTQSGRTATEATPLHVRATGVELDAATRSHVDARTSRQLGKFASHIERVSVRFEDVNGPRGGKDTVCRIKVVLSGLPSVITEERGKTPRAAFDLVALATARAVRKAVGRVGHDLASREARGLVKKAPVRKARAVVTSASQPARIAAGSLIGRRVGRGRKNLLRAAERPEKKRRDALVDTSLPGVSASDRKVGATATATRNTKLNRAGMTATLEDSATGKPSRKSTRRSQNRAKAGSKLERRAKRRLQSPQARARRAAVAR
jgi:ribosome-associated translation inhibitor RaiA